MQEEQARRQKGSKHYPIGTEESFFDFLVGQVDYEKNPLHP
jgi:hypothetical protein